MNTSPSPAPRGRRRSAAADQSILTATLELLATQGYGGMTMGAVTERSGTSSATLYRRWETKQELVAAALASLSPAIIAVDTGSFDGDLAAFIGALADSYCVNPNDLSQDVVAELAQDPAFRTAVTEKFVAPRVDALRGVLRRARQRGELAGPLNAEVAYSLVSGPLHYRVHVQGETLTPSFLRKATVAARAALRAASSPASA